MKWSDDELQRFEPFMEHEIRKKSSWNDRVQRWNNEFKGKNRTASSLRGLWNRLDWGWVPKRQRGSRVDSAVGRVIKPTGSSGRLSQRARLRPRLSRRRVSPSPEPSSPLAPVGSPKREATPTQKREPTPEAPLSQVQPARKSHTAQKTPRPDRGHRQPRLAQSPAGEVPKASNAPVHEDTVNYELAGSLWTCLKYIATKQQPSSPTPRYLSSGPTKIPMRPVHKSRAARRYPAESPRRPFRDTCAT